MKFFKLSFLIIVISFIFILVSVKDAQAAILLVKKDGVVVWNILSSEDYLALGIPKRDSLEIKQLADTNGYMNNSKISLNKQGDKFILNVETDGKERILDVTNYKSDLVEIEERAPAQRLLIKVNNRKFSIENNGIVATTDYQININPKTAELSVKTESGSRFLALLPFEAVESVYRAKVLNRLSRNNLIDLVEDEKGELVYVIGGERVLNLANIIKYPVEVTTKVSAINGEIVFVDQPLWLKVLGFVFI